MTRRNLYPYVDKLSGKEMLGLKKDKERKPKTLTQAELEALLERVKRSMPERRKEVPGLSASARFFVINT